MPAGDLEVAAAAAFAAAVVVKLWLPAGHRDRPSRVADLPVTAAAEPQAA